MQKQKRDDRASYCRGLAMAEELDDFSGVDARYEMEPRNADHYYGDPNRRSFPPGPPRPHRPHPPRDDFYERADHGGSDYYGECNSYNQPQAPRPRPLLGPREEYHGSGLAFSERGSYAQREPHAARGYNFGPRSSRERRAPIEEPHWSQSPSREWGPPIEDARWGQPPSREWGPPIEDPRWGQSPFREWGPPIEEPRWGESQSQRPEPPRKNRPNKIYQNQLMLSEWLIDVPCDFDGRWLMVPSPSGRRVLVVSSQKQTKVFTKGGLERDRFRSNLPGGGPGARHDEYAILDCVFVEGDETYYVLDCLCWNAHPLVDCDAEFRFYWMHNQFDQYDVGRASKGNPWKFVPLPVFCTDKKSMETAVNAKTSYHIDGFLFFHKEGHYTHGITPLVGWLKPYMLTIMFNVCVSKNYANEMPASFVDVASWALKNPAYDYESLQDRKKRHRQKAAPDTEMMIEGAAGERMDLIP